MSAAVRPGDVVCRLGGDEFVVLVEAVPDEHDLQQLGDRLIAAVAEPVDFDGQRVSWPLLDRQRSDRTGG